MVDTNVLIVGAGPVGLALAGDLGWRNVDCTIIERGDGAIFQPKMDLVGIRTMEFCRRWGISEWVESSPYPRDYPQDNVYVTSLTGYEFGRESMPAPDKVPVAPQSPARRERCPQDMFDPILRRFATSFPQVQLRYKTELVSFVEDAAGIAALVRNEMGREQTIRAKFLVGCDGASSAVRRGIGTSMTGTSALTYTTNIIFRSTELPNVHNKGLAYRFIIVGETGTWATIVAINGNDRWRMSIIGNDSPETLTESDIYSAIRRAVGVDFAYEIESIVPWTRSELVAETFSSVGGRVFIAGDAAHVMSPTGGFGMNTGIGDAVDLSWKLAARLDGWAGEGLTQSYEVERRPIALRNVKEASRNLQRMLSPRREIKPPPEFLDDTPVGWRARVNLGLAFGEQMKYEWHTMGIHLGYRYDGSPVISDDGSNMPPDERLTYRQTARPGARAPHVWLRDGTSTLDLFGRDVVLMRLGQAPPAATELIEAADRVGMPLRVATIDDPRVLAAYEARLVLVRPDGHVAWRADYQPETPSEIVDILRGARVGSHLAGASR